MTMTADSLKRSMTNVRPSDDGIGRIEQYRETAKAMADMLFEAVPECPERTLAGRALEEAVMWGVKAICINDPDAREIPIGEK